MMRQKFTRLFNLLWEAVSREGYFVVELDFLQCCGSGSGIRDPMPFWPLDPGSGTSKKSGSGMNNPDHISEGLETTFGLKYLKSLIRWCGFGIRDPGYTKFGYGIRDGKVHPGSATLLFKRAVGFRIIEQLIVMRQPNLSQLAVPVLCKFVLDGKRLKGGGRSPHTLTSQGWFFHHDGMYARNGNRHSVCTLRE